jgi:hypothetical protein
MKKIAPMGLLFLAPLLIMRLSIVASPVSSRETNENQISEAYQQHRKNIFSLIPKKYSAAIEDNDLDRVLMETWLDEGLVTLVVMKDGPATLYYGSGRVLRGAGTSPAITKAHQQLMEESERVIFYAAKTLSNDLPVRGVTYFYFITVNRQYKSGGGDESMINGTSRFSGLFRIGHTMINAIQSGEINPGKRTRVFGWHI